MGLGRSCREPSALHCSQQPTLQTSSPALGWGFVLSHATEHTARTLKRSSPSDVQLGFQRFVVVGLYSWNRVLVRNKASCTGPRLSTSITSTGVHVHHVHVKDANDEGINKLWLNRKLRVNLRWSVEYHQELVELVKIRIWLATLTGALDDLLRIDFVVTFIWYERLHISWAWRKHAVRHTLHKFKQQRHTVVLK